jgi:hypothetical protein
LCHALKRVPHNNSILKISENLKVKYTSTVYALGWVDIGTRTKVPLRCVTYLSKVTRIDDKSVLTQ